MEIEKILETNLKNFMEQKIEREIQNATKEFEYCLLQKKDEYVSHLMKNIRIIHEFNHIDNSMNYKIIFVNEYKVRNEE